MDGRDIGSVVFPDAELKLFITASIEERAKRRFSDLQDVSYDDVLENLMKRDADDSNRNENPLIQASDSILVDNTNMTKKSNSIKSYALCSSYELTNGFITCSIDFLFSK